MTQLHTLLVTVHVAIGAVALRARRQPDFLQRRGHRAMLVALGVLACGLGLAGGHLLLIIFGGLGVAGAIGMLRDTRLRNPGHGDLLPGQWQVIPWVLPAIIGSVAINRLKRRFHRHPPRKPATDVV